MEIAIQVSGGQVRREKTGVEALVDEALLAEELGFGTAFAPDHYVYEVLGNLQREVAAYELFFVEGASFEFRDGDLPAAADSGPFYVQVFAGRDRRASERLLGELQSAGYAVRVFSEKEAGGMLYKVRVGGYEQESGARETAAKLRESGYSGAWVTRLD